MFSREDRIVGKCRQFHDLGLGDPSILRIFWLTEQDSKVGSATDGAEEGREEKDRCGS